MHYRSTHCYDSSICSFLASIIENLLGVNVKDMTHIQQIFNYKIKFGFPDIMIPYMDSCL